MKGTCKWFNDRKGFGFIETEENDYFVHYSEIEAEDKVFKCLREGETVEFEPSESNKGKCAINVRRLFDEN